MDSGTLGDQFKSSSGGAPAARWIAPTSGSPPRLFAAGILKGKLPPDGHKVILIADTNIYAYALFQSGLLKYQIGLFFSEDRDQG